MTNIDYSKLYFKYVDDVLNGRIVTGKLIKLACKRTLDFANRDDLYFDYEEVDKIIKFIQKMRMIKGLKAGENLILLPYQSWIIGQIFGWKYKDTKLRVTTNVMISMARQNGKSALAAAIALACLLCVGEISPSICFIANSAPQAKILFDHCKGFAGTLDPRHKIFRMLRQNLYVDKINGEIRVLSADTSKLDGLSPSLFIQDEGHASKTDETFSVLKTGQGSRKSPLAVTISTVGFLVGEQYPMYAQWKTCENILRGNTIDDTWFSALFQIDEEDQWDDETCWIKSNPSLGAAIDIKFLRDQILSAKNNPHKFTTVCTKNLNRWMQSAKAWFTLETIDNIFKYKIDEGMFAGDNCYMGLDLSKSSDLTAFALLFPPDESRDFYPEKFIFKPYVYIPDIAVEKSPNKEFYKVWLRDGYAISSAGNVIDYDQILRDMINSQEAFNLLLAAYDPWRAPLLVTNAEKAGLPMAPFKQSRTNFSKVIDCFEMLANSGNILIDKSPLTKWSLNNVEISEDKFGNMLCEKANGDPAAKIDPIMACLMALGAYLSENTFDPMVYTI